MMPAVDVPPGAIPWDDGFEVVTSDGKTLRAALWEGETDLTALLLSGRTEFLEKMAIPATALVERGFTVISCDWRGQGLSERLAEPRIMGHVERFTDYHLDLKALLAAPQVARFGEIDLLLAHSMGGAIGLGALYRGLIKPRSVVFSAPMLGFEMSKALRMAGFVTTKIAEFLGKLDKRPPFGAVDKPYVFEGFEGNVLTSDRAVFDWMVKALQDEPRLQLAVPSMRWLDQSMEEMEWFTRQGRLNLPILFLDGSDEAVVDGAAIDAAVARLGAEMVTIDGARHEVLIESEPMRGRAWQAIDRFLAANGITAVSD
ncbi:MAG: alpha/beta hydrolase [Pseudomonadota bacterium]